PKTGELERLRDALVAAGRDPAEVELVGGTRGVFPDAESVAEVRPALEAVPAQLAAGFTTICIKPSQFTDDPRQIGPLCREIVASVEALAT
ncbi:MAG: F420-dependent oxidoreductase, partial [Actinomycetota bacterium]|nr:F420-dependent oxidoreductase [Actinomycetota bacterium]